MLVLDEAVVADLIDMDAAIRAMRDLRDRTHRGTIDVIPRRRLEDGGLYLATMSAADHSHHWFAAKFYTTGERRGSFKLMLWDSRTGELKALLDANRLGQLRTGAVSAVMTDLLAQPGAECLLLIGTGYQAETQALAIARVRHLKTIFVYSRSPAHRLAFAQRIDAQLGGTTAVKPVDTVSAVAAESQIIVTATTSRDPVLQGEWIAPGTHINAVGSNHPTHREIDQEVLRRADLIVTDHMEGARLESGDLLLGLKESEWSRVTSWEQPLSRPSAKAITVFVSQGIASEDLVMAEYVMERWMQTTKAGRVNG